MNKILQLAHDIFAILGLEFGRLGGTMEAGLWSDYMYTCTWIKLNQSRPDDSKNNTENKALD